MSKYEEQDDDNLSICPYCGESYQVESEDYNEDPHEVECFDCGKKYWLHQSFSVTNHTEPDCELNGEKHDFKLSSSGKAYFCRTCDKCVLKLMSKWDRLKTSMLHSLIMLTVAALIVSAITIIRPIFASVGPVGQILTFAVVIFVLCTAIAYELEM